MRRISKSRYWWVDACLRFLLPSSLLLLGLFFVGKGLWLPAKAQLAQLLIADAWRKTLDGQVSAKPWPWSDTWPIASLQWTDSSYVNDRDHENIKKGINKNAENDIDLIVLAGSSGHALAFGPGHMTGSAFPGEPGTSVIAGHRDTHFKFLERLSLGDTLTVVNNKGRSMRFRITELLVINSETDQVQFEQTVSQLVLVTCYPFRAINANGPLRYVVRAEAAYENRV